MKMLANYLTKLEPQFTELKQRYQQLAVREQQMLIALSVIVPCFLFVFLYWQPMQLQLKQLQDNRVQLEKDFVEAKSLAKQIQKTGRQSSQLQGSFMAQIEQLAKQAAVRAQIIHLKPQTGMDGRVRMRIRLQQVGYAKSMNFLHALAQAGFNLELAKLDRLAKPAYINMDLWVMQP